MSWVLVLFTVVSAWAHQPTVKVTSGRNITDLVQYYFQESIQDFRDKSSGMTLKKPGILSFSQTPVGCPYGADLVVELSIQRSQILPGPLGQKISEALILQACGFQVQILKLVRHGPTLSPIPDEDFLGGKIKDHMKVDRFELSLNDSILRLEYSKNGDMEKYFFAIDERGGNPDIRIYTDEKYSGSVLTHQTQTLQVYTGVTLKEEHITEFIWSFDPRYKNPRQYLFYQGQETSPAGWVEIMSAYSGFLGPVIRGALSNMPF